jgi:ubiquinone/menaquinone biosynthesis C-methylase UbiE
MTSGSIPTPSHRWRAAVYDNLARLDEKKLEPLRKQLIAGATGRVIEIGAGTGINLAHYDWSKVQSLDLTEPDPFMRRRAEARLADMPSEIRARVRLHPSLAEDLHFTDGEFDCGVATLVLCTVSNPVRALEEIHRVLTPSAELRLMEHVRPTGKADRVQQIIQPIYGWFTGGCHLDRETENTVRKAGFVLAITSRVSLGPLWPIFVGSATKTREESG